ncbi:hypothetical protein IW136_001360 [Coemansia sp. RSA 678]|nr:hypothetical protein IW136_001360 [Coemansia sp. RSA 678]
MASRDHIPQHRYGSGHNPRQPATHAEQDTSLANIHSRAIAREQLRRQQQQQGTGSVLADLNSLHTQQNKDMRTMFVPTPRDSIPASVYVSGHLSPADQWVAVGNGSSGVISLTESDIEDDDTVPDIKGKRAASYSRVGMPVDAHYSLPPQTNNERAVGHNATGADPQTVHLLRESVASLLSAANSPSSSSVSSAQPYIVGAGSRRQHAQIRQSASTSGRPRHSHEYARSQSPSDVSKISEPCYLASAPRPRVTANLDRFSDIALSNYAVATPPFQQQRPPAHPHLAHDASRPSTQLPTYEEFRQRQRGARASEGHVPSYNVGASSAIPVPTGHVAEPRSMLGRQTVGGPRVGVSDVEASTAVNSAARVHAHHPLLGDYGVHRRTGQHMSESSHGSRSPFASIRTVSPVMMNEQNTVLGPATNLELDAVTRAQAEAALEQTIQCPLSQTIDTAYTARDSNKDTPGEIPGDSCSILRQSWAKYTGYAIVGFGVVSGEAPTEPVISAKTGRIYEKRILLKYMEEHGREPQTEHALSADDMISVDGAPPVVRPRPPTLTSVPALLSTFQNEWDAVVLETFALKQQYEQVRRELSQALYQNDAACRVVARLVRERDEARAALAALNVQVSASAEVQQKPNRADQMDVDGTPEPSGGDHTDQKDQDHGELSAEDTYYERAAETSRVLSAMRMKRETPAGLVTPEAWKTAREAQTVETLHTTTKPGIVGLDVDRSGDLALTAGLDNHAEVFSRSRDQTLATLKGHTKRVTSAAWVPNASGLSAHIVTGSADKSVRVWGPKPANSDDDAGVRAIGWTKLCIIKHHTAEVVGVAVHPSNGYVASAAADGSWAVHSLQGETVVSGTVDAPVSRIAFHPDGTFLGLGTRDGQAKIVDVKQRQVLATLDVAADAEGDAAEVNGLHFSENGYYFVTTSAREAAVWDLRKQKKTKVWDLKDLAPDAEAEAAFTAARFDVSGKYLAVVADRVVVLKVKGWAQLAELPVGEFPARAVAWVGDTASAVVAATMDNSLHYYEPAQE